MHGVHRFRDGASPPLSARQRLLSVFSVRLPSSAESRVRDKDAGFYAATEALLRPSASMSRLPGPVPPVTADRRNTSSVDRLDVFDPLRRRRSSSNFSPDRMPVRPRRIIRAAK